VRTTEVTNLEETIPRSEHPPSDNGGNARSGFLHVHKYTGEVDIIKTVTFDELRI
jgi:hypothetical protein